MKLSLLLLAGMLLVAPPLDRGARAAAAAPPSTAPSIDCRVPPELVEDSPGMPELARRFRAKKPVTIVAIGGASTAGLAAGGEGRNSYPRRLEAALRRRHPDVPIAVINKGVPRQTAQDMVDRFPKDVYPHDPALVIWETGTVEAVRGYDVEAFIGALYEGIAALRAHKADIMLVDMQYSRSTASVIYYEPYLDALRHTADVEDIYLFRRYDMMAYWSESGVFDFVDVPRQQRARLAAEVYGCLGERMADAIDHAIR